MTPVCSDTTLQDTETFFELLHHHLGTDCPELVTNFGVSRFAAAVRRLPEKLQHRRFSASSIKEYQSCPRKFYYHRITEQPETHPSATHYTWLGLAVHNTMYFMVADLVEDGVRAGPARARGPVKPGESAAHTPLPKYTWKVRDAVRSMDEVKAFFFDIWFQRPEQADPSLTNAYLAGDMPSARPKAFVLNATLSKRVAHRNKTQEEIEEFWRDKAWEMVKTGYSYMQTHAAPLLAHLTIEHELDFTYAGERFVGYIDMLFRPPGQEMFFLDFKTGQEEPGDLSKDAQFVLYRSALRDLFKLRYEPVGLYVHLTSQQVFPHRDPLRQWQSEGIDKALDGVARQDWRANLLDWKCKGCEYRGYCFTKEKSGATPDVAGPLTPR